MFKFMTGQLTESGQVWLVWKGRQEKPLLSIKSMTARLKLHLKKPQDVWNNVLWTDETKVEIYVHNAWRQLQPLIPTVQHGGGEEDLDLFCSHRTRAPCSH